MIVLSTYMKVAIGLLVAAFLLQVIGLATPYWNNFGGGSHIGLWQSCSYRYGCNEYSASTGISAARAFEVLGLILLAIVLILLLYYCCKEPNPQLLLAGAICSFVTAGLIVLGIICWVASYTSTSLSWSFVLCIIAAVLAVIGGVLLIPERRSRVIIVGGSAGTTRTTHTTTTVTVTRK